jgi:hypothetical protein
LDLIGTVPVFGEGADLLNAASYALEGDWKNVGYSTAALMPLGGSLVTSAKYANRVVENSALRAATVTGSLPFFNTNRAKELFDKKDNLGTIYYMHSHPTKGGKPYFGKAENGINKRYNPNSPEYKAADPIIIDVPGNIIEGVETNLMNLNGGYKSLKNPNSKLSNKRASTKDPDILNESEKWLNSTYPGWQTEFKIKD